jgi:DNA polymerase III subunit epsilon
MVMKKRQLILDTETTGLDPIAGHRIIEFAALEMVDRKLTGGSLHLYINPERKIDAGATRIHGITDKQVADKPTFKQVAQQIIDYIKDADLIIHNAKFDVGFLDHQLKLEQLDPINKHAATVIDTLIMARQKFAGSKNSLDALCDRFKINRSHRDLHGALVDCRLLADVYLALTREQISLLEDEHNTKDAIKHTFSKLQLSQQLKVITANTDELKEHEVYLQELDKLSKGNSLWYKLDGKN